ncbi:uncharacterized protein LOC113418149 isoform X1 [Notechis scutatus]|uniref:Uncharacterized protein LOC113418149 isoform X1 n=1 Tax=Notechis scutatus TaxID=8663 RepID=A0A6J1UYE8_9SAUR|nr:uncharacterized protein LOC113418149 isoform X1 [Notechis scutatus]
MDRGFFPRRKRFPRRCHDQWFQQNYIPNENFWMDSWDMPQNQFPKRPPPWRNHHYPDQERPYNVGFDNYTRGSYHRRPYRGRFCTRSKKTLKGRGNFQNQSSSSFSINVPVKPKDSQPDEESPSQTDSVVSAETVAEEESPPGITKIPLHTQNEDIVLQLQDKLKDCEVTEDLLSQTVSILSPGVSTEDKTSSCSTEVFQNIEEKDSILRSFSFRLPVDVAATSVAGIADLRSCAELSPSKGFVRSQNHPVGEAKDTTLLLDPGKALNPKGEEQQWPPCLPQSWNSQSNKGSAGASRGTVCDWLQASQFAQDSSHGFSTTAVEISFLSENANDDQCERREEIELTKTSAKQDDTDDSQAYAAAPALDSSSLPSTLNDIPHESLLVREKDNELTEISAKHQNDTDDSQAYVVAPALDSSSLPNTLNDIPFEPVLVREKDTGLTEISAKQNDTDGSQAYVVAPALGFSSLPSTLNDIPREPVLVREKDTGLTETSAKHQNDTDGSQAYVVAPALGFSSLPSTLNDIPCEPVLLREIDTGLTEISAKHQNDTDDSQAYFVAPALDSSSLPSTLNDIPFEPVQVREIDTGLTETSAKQDDTDDSQAYVVAPALGFSSLPSTLNDIRCVPVLVRRKVIELAENQRAWAPEDYQEPPWNVNQADQYLKVSECYKDSVSTSISSNGNRNIESLVKSKSCSPRIHHSISSKHSSTNQTSRDLRCQSPKSYVKQECSSRSFGKRELSTERQDRSSKLSCRRERSSGSSLKQEVSPQREKHTSKSPYSQKQSSQKRDRNPKTSLMQEHSVKSTHKQKHSSSSPKMKENSKSQKLDRWKKKKSGRSCCCHCNYHCQQSCSPSRESLWHRCCSPSYLTCKIEHLNVSKEIGNVYGMPYHLSPEKSIANKKEIRESRQVVEPKIPVIEKKRKRAKSRTGRKPLKIQSSTKKKRTSSPCHLNAEEETSVPSWTPKDRSAAVLARKEELEQAYLQVLLNFGAIAIMLVEKEPCMIEAMSSALRTNLRKIGNYYECLLKNYIDSLTEAN